MLIYIALLRGINVGGKNMIKMADLKRTLEAMGAGQVQTYIQSGNVLFESDQGPDQLRQRIEQEIRTAFGISATVVLRTARELDRIVADCPFPSGALKQGESIYVGFLTDPLMASAIDRLSEGKEESDELQVMGLDIYFLLRQSILDARLAKNVQKLGNSVTIRNWNTVKKLHSLAQGMAGEGGAPRGGESL
jgi:uncharacterized protein (DUF1697 family)